MGYYTGYSSHWANPQVSRAPADKQSMRFELNTTPLEHLLEGPEAVCKVCECAPGYMTTDCFGTVLTAYQKCRVGRGRLDYLNAEWKHKITLPRFVGSFEEVNAFLEADL